MNKAVILVTITIFLTGADVPAGEATRAAQAPVVDGIPDDAAWESAHWRNLTQVIIGSPPEAEDFTGRYKVVWTPEHLFVLAEITDDILVDSHSDPLEFYWEDDTFEILIDEDGSGGLHQFNYNAFAYHIALDNQVVDIAPYASEADRAAGRYNVRTYPHHVQAVWKRSLNDPNRLYWEVRISVFGDDYKDHYAAGEAPAQPVRLNAGKKLGFMVTYCDADSAAGRELFIGDVEIEPVNGDRNLGYIDASVFGELTLVD